MENRLMLPIGLVMQDFKVLTSISRHAYPSPDYFPASFFVQHGLGIRTASFLVILVVRLDTHTTFLNTLTRSH